MSNLVLAVGLLLTVTLKTSAEKPHPRVFLTRSDVERVRKAVAADAAFARWADDLAGHAAAEKIADLPPLERTWWETDRKRPWLETYPQIWHHTMVVSLRWADLARRCARASMVRPEAKLAEKGKEVLLRLADYTFEFEHYDVGLNYTIFATAALEAYDILYDAFDAAGRQKVDAFFHRFLAAVEKNDRYWIEHEPGGGLNNHYAWHKLGFLLVGLFYDRPQLVEEAFRGPKGIDFLMRHGFTDDGLWMEGSIPYQFAATAAMLVAAETLENTGHPRSLYRQETADGRTLKAAYDALFPLLFPDRTLPAIGDCYGQRPHLGKHHDWEILCRRFRDPRYAWLLRDLKERSRQALFDGLAQLPAADPPGQHSRLWPEHGYAALRTVEGPEYWSGRGWTLFATYSNNLVHENADKLSIQLFGEGHLWLSDCEARPGAEHSFSAAVQSQLNRETLCHNALLVDGRSQRHPNRQLDLVEYHVLPNVKRLTIGDVSGRLYPGVRQLRTCIVRAEYVLDFLQVKADKPRELAWIAHVDGTPSASSVEKPLAPAVFPAQPPWSYLRTPRRADAANLYWETFRHGDRAFRMDVSCSGPQELVTCGFPKDDGPNPDTIPMRMLRSRAADAWYAAVYRCGTSLDAPMRLDAAPGESGNWLVTVALGNTRFTHRVPQLPEQGPPGKAGGASPPLGTRTQLSWTARNGLLARRPIQPSGRLDYGQGSPVQVP